MNTQPITPQMWQRMPWHPKAQLVARLDAEIERKRAELRGLLGQAGLAFDEVDIARNLAAARAYVALAKPDPAAWHHLDELRRDIEERMGPRPRHEYPKPRDRHGRFASTPDLKESA